MKVINSEKEQYQHPLVEFWALSDLADMICASPGNQGGDYIDDEW